MNKTTRKLKPAHRHDNTFFPARILPAALTIILTLILLTAPAAADTQHITTYALLTEALNTADTIQLDSDIQLDATLQISTDTTLDLNGHTLTAPPGSTAIKINSGTLTLRDSQPANNGGRITGAGNSGIIIENSAALIMNGGSIVGCTATYGGAIENRGTFTMNGGSIVDCTATNNGGGGAIDNAGTFTMNGGDIVGCSADFGGAIDNTKTGTCTINHGNIISCTASQNGGGIRNSGILFMNGGKITQCRASGNGGGIFAATGSTTTLNGGIITDCTAGLNGNTICYAGNLIIYRGISDMDPYKNKNGVLNQNYSFTITLKSSNEPGARTATQYMSGTTDTIIANPFTPPENKVFAGWKNGNTLCDEYAAVPSIIQTLTAQWVDKTDITGAKLALDENLNLLFYTEDTTATQMTFTIDDTSEKPAQIDTHPVQSANLLCFKFTGISPRDMGKTITAALTKGNGETVTFAYSIKAYCINTLKNPPAEYTPAQQETLQTLISDTLTYGEAAQKYLGETGDNLVTYHLPVPLSPSPTPVITMTDDIRKITTNKQTEGLRITEAGLWFDSTNRLLFVIDTAGSQTEGLSVKVTPKDGGTPQTYSPFEADPLQTSDRNHYRIKTVPLSAADITKKFTVTLMNGKETADTIDTYTAAGYVYMMANERTDGKQSASEEMKDLALKTYNYGISAKNFREAVQ